MLVYFNIAAKNKLI